MNGSYLFDSLYDEDPDGQKINFMPGVKELLAAYKEKMTAICMQIFQLGLLV